MLTGAKLLCVQAARRVLCVNAPSRCNRERQLDLVIERQLIERLSSTVWQLDRPKQRLEEGGRGVSEKYQGG